MLIIYYTKYMLIYPNNNTFHLNGPLKSSECFYLSYIMGWFDLDTWNFISDIVFCFLATHFKVEKVLGHCTDQKEKVIK